MLDPFYRKGLRFSCKKCGNCCRISDGFVYISNKDIAQITEALDLTENEFLDKYTEKNNGFVALKSYPNGDCIFFTENIGCKVYNHRPRQCRTFPFWSNALSSQKNWELLSSYCPGINTGILYTKNEIEKILIGTMETKEG